MNQKKRNIILGVIAGVAIAAAITITVISTRPPVVEQPPPDETFVPRPNRAVAEDFNPDD